MMRRVVDHNYIGDSFYGKIQGREFWLKHRSKKWYYIGIIDHLGDQRMQYFGNENVFKEKYPDVHGYIKVWLRLHR